MKESLGIVEIEGLATSVLVADCMVKTANVHLVGMEPAKGMGYMTIKITGDVGAVKAAVSAGKDLALRQGKYISASVIARPATGTVAMCLPAEPAETPEEQEAAVAQTETGAEKQSAIPAKTPETAKKGSAGKVAEAEKTEAAGAEKKSKGAAAKPVGSNVPELAQS